MFESAHDEYALRTFPQGFWSGWEQYLREEPRPDAELQAFWAQVRESQAKKRWACPRHLVVDRFSFDPGEIGVTTDSDGGNW